MKSKFELVWSLEYLKQINRIKKNKPKQYQQQYFGKIEQLISAIMESPFSGLGKPEHLKHQLPPCWSRRINIKDRLIYRIRERTVEIISIIGYYE